MSLLFCEQGASRERQPDSTHVVNMWHIPNGSDYHDAQVVHAFFSSEEQAQKAAKNFEMPPEMAHCMTIEQYDEIRAKVKREHNPDR